MRTKRLVSVVATALVALLLLVACSPAPPKDPASISGSITTVTAGVGALGSVLIEGPADAHDKASVNITASTTLLRKTTDGYEEIAFADLKVGMSADVWFTGPVAESYPVQATADTLVVTN